MVFGLKCLLIKQAKNSVTAVKTIFKDEKQDNIHPGQDQAERQTNIFQNKIKGPSGGLGGRNFMAHNILGEFFSAKHLGYMLIYMIIKN